MTTMSQRDWYMLSSAFEEAFAAPQTHREVTSAIARCSLARNASLASTAPKMSTGLSSSSTDPEVTGFRLRVDTNVDYPVANGAGPFDLHEDSLVARLWQVRSQPCARTDAKPTNR